MLFFIFIIVGIYLSRPLYDPDFYWHLKTGQWIWLNKSLPHIDPFGVPPLPESSPRNDFILTSYWLIQLILYAFYSFCGMPGVIIFRWVIAGLAFLICSAWANLRNSSVTAVIAIGTVQLLEYYFIERPQFISFICFGAVLVILFRFIDHRAGGSLWSTLVPLSLVMTAWANMHGGFLIGQAVLIYFTIAEGIKLLNPALGPLSVRDYRRLLLCSVTALAASFINPNALDLIGYLPIIFDADNYANVNVLEEMSIIAYFRETGSYIIFLYLTSIVLTAAALLFSRHRKDITWLGILAAAAYMGCQHMRLMPFFLVSAVLFMTRYFETECPGRKGKVILIAMLVVTAVCGLREEVPRIIEAAKSGSVPAGQYPVKSADYIAANNISGNIYTTLQWGGYMIWRAGPENKVFHDSRMLNLQRAWEYNNSLMISLNQRPYWKGLFDIYDIQVAVLPIYDDDGDPDLLTQSIANDTSWKIVFAAGNEAVFERIGPD